MSKYVRQINVKLSDELMEELLLISKYFGLKAPELVRRWIFDGLAEMGRDRRYQQWREKETAPGGMEE